MQQLTVQQHILDPERPSSSLNMLDTLTYLDLESASESSLPCEA